MEIIGLFFVLLIVGMIYKLYAMHWQGKLMTWADKLGFEYKTGRHIEGIGIVDNYMTFPLKTLETGYIAQEKEAFNTYFYLRPSKHSTLNLCIVAKLSTPLYFSIRLKSRFDKDIIPTGIEKFDEKFILMGKDKKEVIQLLKDSPKLLDFLREGNPENEALRPDITRSIHAQNGFLTYQTYCPMFVMYTPETELKAIQEEFTTQILPYLN